MSPFSRTKEHLQQQAPTIFRFCNSRQNALQKTVYYNAINGVSHCKTRPFTKPTKSDKI